MDRCCGVYYGGSFRKLQDILGFPSIIVFATLSYGSVDKYGSGHSALLHG